MVQEEKEEGIVLTSFDYHERARIVTLFTSRVGVINLIVKNISKRDGALMRLTKPFTCGEFLYQRGKSDLYRFLDGTVLKPHLSFRRSLQQLQVGVNMLRLIRLSQLPGKGAPLLYQLLLVYLKQLATFFPSENLWVSFALKLLKHEGTLSLVRSCSRCSLQPARALKRGESLCLVCSDEETILFSEREWEVLIELLEAREFAFLQQPQVGEALVRKIERYLQIEFPKHPGPFFSLHFDG